MKEQNFDTAYQEIKKIVEKFKQGEQSYLSQSYSEAALRQDFLDDFFTALGWDVRHQIQHDPYEQEVKIEQGVKISGAQKRADYSFSIAPNFRDPKFFAEAKKPAKALKNAQDYFQSIRYGWHKAHPLSILTDFEELHIIDCRSTPDINNSLAQCYKQFHYTDYLNKEKFAEIYFLFSREAVANNSIEKFAETLPKRKGKAAKFILHQTIDEAFLEVIDGIRERLAKSFKKQDENLTSEELTEATQRTVDRLVFIRFLEDKLIEQEHWVSGFGEKGSVWNDFISACRKLDAKYNGIVFKEHFIDEQSFAGPEASEFRTICQDICHLNSRFLFNEIPIHILGSIYERFLGKVVHATPKRVTVEEKPEVRKAGGVYYTPKYIVDYIVNNTVGKLIEGKTPEQIAKLRFADIACGSGSFLIGVFDCLLDHHNKYYQKHPDKAKKDGCIQKDGLWVLSIKQKQKILLNNIYGVDIDQQATEVTQLSLALKLLEDETTATANEMQVLFHEKILPDMSKNIICGNSLIGNDILTQKKLFSEEEEQKLNPFDFEIIFPEVFRSKMEEGYIYSPPEGFDEDQDIDTIKVKEPMEPYKKIIRGGFDAIVGNPPYVNAIQLSDLYGDEFKNYLKAKYKSTRGTFDIYIPFFERAITLCKEGGLVSYITPNKFLSSPYGIEFRKLIVENYSLNELVDYSSVKVFDKPSVYPVISNFSNKRATKKYNIEIKKAKNADGEYITKKISSEYLNLLPENLWGILLSESIDVVNRIFSCGVKLEDVANVNATSTAAESEEFSKFIHEKNPGKKYLKIINTGTIDRYISTYGIDVFSNKGKKLLHPVIDLSKITEKRRILYQTPKIVFAKLALQIEGFPDFNGEFASINTNCVYNPQNGISLHYLCALVNSKLLTYIYAQLFSGLRMSGGYFQFQSPQLRLLPIRVIDFQNKTEKSAHAQIVVLVEQMLQAKKEIKTAKTAQDKTYSERKCSSLDAAIDAEVYKLYDLTEEEIRIVEGKISQKRSKTNEWHTKPKILCL